MSRVQVYKRMGKRNNLRFRHTMTDDDDDDDQIISDIS